MQGDIDVKRGVIQNVLTYVGVVIRVRIVRDIVFTS
jgi:hypothetical protein